MAVGRARELLTRIRRVLRDYRQVHGRWPNLIRPARYSEKIQWRKLFDADPRYAVFCDKLATRALVAARCGEHLLAPLLWSGGVAALRLDEVAPPYVLKSSHASGQVVMVQDDAPLDAAHLRRLAAAWLECDYGQSANEPAYSAVPRRLLIERCVRDDGGGRPQELRIFVFDGRARILNTVFIEDGEVRNGAFHTPDWQRLDWHFSRRIERDFPRPACLQAMLQAAERLGQGLDHVRIDFFDGGSRFWIGEITVYPWSGMARFTPDEADRQMGACWHLRRPLRRAVLALLRAVV